MSNDPFALGPTFTPGGADDFHIPQNPADVVSPTLQWAVQEMPGQISHGIASLDLHDSDTLYYGDHSSAARQYSKLEHFHSQYARQVPGLVPLRTAEATIEVSPFPKLHKRTPNVPPSDEERLAILGAARLQVLSSPNPESQLSWAQDALTYSDTCVEDDRRSGISHIKAQRFASTLEKLGEQIRTDAINIVLFLADQYHPRADFMKGMWFEFGKFGFEENKLEAFRCYKRSAAKGYARAEYRIGMQYEFTGEHMKALQHYRSGQAQGDTASCYRMGMMALLGQLGQPQDYATAIRLIRQAADDADEQAPQGAYVYGMLQARELPHINVPEAFLPQDLSSAVRYIETSAYLGFAKAQLKMGSAYELCSLGCEFDPVLSMHYNLLAARQGEAEAEMSISKWMLCGYQNLFPKNEELAFRYAQRAAATGLATAEFAIGYYHEVGVYVGRNLVQARDWYEKAARDGNTDARGRLLNLSKSHALSKSDHEDIAISRIKSQHGSRRVNRYEHPGKPTNPMPRLPDEYLQSTGITRKETQENRISPTSALLTSQFRTASTTPYPIDDRPGISTSYPVKNTATVQASGRDRPLGGFLHLNLNQQSFSTMVDGGRLDMTGTSCINPASSNSPVPSQMETNVRNNHEPFTSKVEPTGRLDPNRGTSPPQPNNIGFTSRVHDIHAADHATLSQNSSPVEMLDIGFIAPIDPRASQAVQPSAVSDLNRKKVGTRSPTGGSSKKTVQAQAQAQAHAQRTGTPKTASTPGGRGPVIPWSSVVGNEIDESEGRTPSFSVQSWRPPVPSKGRQTFEQMGIPTAKREDDCRIM